MVGIVAAVLFFVAFLINAADISTNDVFSSTNVTGAGTDVPGSAYGRGRDQLGPQTLTLGCASDAQNTR
ncbi:hypothetical protein ACWKT3_41170 [Streptomyces violaceus]